MAEKKVNDGTELQAKLQKALKEYTSKQAGTWHRFPDTKSARLNFIQSQPGDFFLLVPGMSVLIECKSSVVGEALLNLAYHGEVGRRQIAKHKLWHRAGHPSLYLYGDMRGKQKMFAWHLGTDVVAKVSDPKVIGCITALEESLPNILSYLMA
jgi:hypothetical protein